MKKQGRRFVPLLLICTAPFLGNTPGNAQGPEQVGKWGPVVNISVNAAVHAVLLHTGSVLFISEDPLGLNAARLYQPPQCDGGSRAGFPCVTDADCPGAGACGADVVTVIDSPKFANGQRIVIYCSGHAQLGDGRVVFMGGGAGDPQFAHQHTVMFEPMAASTTCTVDAECASFLSGMCMSASGLCNPWKQMDDMPQLLINGEWKDGIRWYPTCTTLGDGRIMVLGGPHDLDPATTTIPVIFDATKGPESWFGKTRSELLDRRVHGRCKVHRIGLLPRVLEIRFQHSEHRQVAFF